MTPESDNRHPFPGLTRIGTLLSDPGRAAILWSLMDGSARPAGELAMIAGVSPSAGSAHLARLTDGGLLTLEISGRHRYYRIAAPDVAVAIEALANLASASAPAREARSASPRPSPVPLAMRYVRTCYDHLAGELAVQLFDRMLGSGWLEAAHDAQSSGPTLLDATEKGRKEFARLGIDLMAQRARRRRFACTCIDWSERRPHLGGALGAAFLDACSSHGWLEHTASRRGLRVTPAGQESFGRLLAQRPLRVE
jgi:DNA-binding transcriptional ArsR family regulator